MFRSGPKRRKKFNPDRNRTREKLSGNRTQGLKATLKYVNVALKYFFCVAVGLRCPPFLLSPMHGRMRNKYLAFFRIILGFLYFKKFRPTNDKIFPKVNFWPTFFEVKFRPSKVSANFFFEFKFRPTFF